MSTNKNQKNWLRYSVAIIVSGLILTLGTFSISTVYEIVHCSPLPTELVDYDERQPLNGRGWPMQYYLDPPPEACNVSDTNEADIGSHFYVAPFVINLTMWSAVVFGLSFIYSRIRMKI